MSFRILSAAILAFAAYPALAEDVPLPPLTPEGEYMVMTQDDATSTSKCIGNPVTPLCAIETEIACRVRNDYELCRVAMGLDSEKYINKGAQQRPRIYRIVRAEALTEQNFPWRPTRKLPWRPGEPSIQVGDIRIDLIERDCPWGLTPDGCHVGQTMAYIVRREGDKWALIEAGDPNDPRIQ